MPFNLFGSDTTPDLSQLDANFSAVALVVTNLTALRAVPKPGSSTGSTGTVMTLGGSTAGDGLGGIYWYDASDTSSTDNGSTIIVASDAGRWKLGSTLTNVSTQGVTNNGTSPASTAFVRQMGVQRRAITSRTAGATLTTSDLGALQAWSGTSAATLVLPSASAFPPGTGIEFEGGGSSMAVCTISRAGTDTIADGEATGLTSIAISQPGAGFWLVSDGSAAWNYVGPRRRYESAWTQNLPAAGTSTSATHGLGTTPRQWGVIMECTTADAGYSVGDRAVILGAEAVGSFRVYPAITAASSTQVSFITALGWTAVRKSDGALVAATSTSWKYRLWAEV